MRSNVCVCVCVCVFVHNVLLGLCSCGGLCNCERWGNDPLEQVGRGCGEGQETQEEFSAGFLKALLNFQDASVLLLFQMVGELGVGGWGENWRRLRSPGDLCAWFCFGDGVTVAGLLGRLCASRDVAVELRIPKPHTSNPKQALSGCGGVFCRSPIPSQQAQMGSNKFLTRSYLFE